MISNIMKIKSVLDSEGILTEEHRWSILSVEARPDCTIVQKKEYKIRRT